MAFKVITNEKTSFFKGDTTIFVTAKTKGIDADREKEKCTYFNYLIQVVTLQRIKKNIRRPAKIGQKKKFWTN